MSWRGLWVVCVCVRVCVCEQPYVRMQMFECTASDFREEVGT